MQIPLTVATLPLKLTGACDMMHSNVEDLINQYTEILDRDPMDQIEDTQTILRKFTQALALECASVVENNLYQGIGYNTSKKVKEHFGVSK